MASFKWLLTFIVTGLCLQANAEPAHQIYNPFSLTAGASIGFGNLALVMQGDGNLVLYRDGNTALWSTGTAGRDCSGCVANFQSDGNLVLYKGSEAFAWSGTQGSGYQLKISAALPYLSIVSGASTVWSGSSALQSLVIESGYVTRVGDLNLAMQSDGNLVLYSGNTALWSTNTAGRDCGFRGCSAVMQDDGNFVLYQNGSPYWSTGTQGQGLLLFVTASAPYISVLSGNTRVWPVAAPAQAPSSSSGSVELNCWGKPVATYGRCG